MYFVSKSTVTGNIIDDMFRAPWKKCCLQSSSTLHPVVSNYKIWLQLSCFFKNNWCKRSETTYSISLVFLLAITNVTNEAITRRYIGSGSHKRWADVTNCMCARELSSTNSLDYSLSLESILGICWPICCPFRMISMSSRAACGLCSVCDMINNYQQPSVRPVK